MNIFFKKKHHGKKYLTFYFIATNKKLWHLICDIDPLYKQSDVLASIEAQEHFYKIILVTSYTACIIKLIIIFILEILEWKKF